MKHNEEFVRRELFEEGEIIMEEMSCGCVTLNKPFTFEVSIKGTFHILFNGKYHSVVGGGGLDSDGMEKMMDMMNDAYQKGFSDCGSELMPKLMEKSNG